MSGERAGFRPRRSVLYLPSSNERAMEKAKTLPVDALILDLEDAVAPDAKALARESACAAAGSGAYGQRELTIRVNGAARIGVIEQRAILHRNAERASEIDQSPNGFALDAVVEQNHKLRFGLQLLA